MLNQEKFQVTWNQKWNPPPLYLILFRLLLFPHDEELSGLDFESMMLKCGLISEWFSLRHIITSFTNYYKPQAICLKTWRKCMLFQSIFHPSHIFSSSISQNTLSENFSIEEAGFSGLHLSKPTSFVYLLPISSPPLPSSSLTDNRDKDLHLFINLLSVFLFTTSFRFHYSLC